MWLLSFNKMHLKFICVVVLIVFHCVDAVPASYDIICDPCPSSNIHIHKIVPRIDAPWDSETVTLKACFLSFFKDRVSLSFIYCGYFLQLSITLTFQGGLEPTLNYFG